MVLALTQVRVECLVGCGHERGQIFWTSRLVLLVVSFLSQRTRRRLLVEILGALQRICQRADSLLDDVEHGFLDRVVDYFRELDLADIVLYDKLFASFGFLTIVTLLRGGFLLFR